LAAKPSVRENAAQVAKEMVHIYKDHGFVIDLARALERLENEPETPATSPDSHTVRTNTAGDANGRPERPAVTH
jgi:hypothetical protein